MMPINNEHKANITNKEQRERESFLSWSYTYLIIAGIFIFVLIPNYFFPQFYILSEIESAIIKFAIMFFTLGSFVAWLFAHKKT